MVKTSMLPAVAAVLSCLLLSLVHATGESPQSPSAPSSSTPSSSAAGSSSASGATASSTGSAGAVGTVAGDGSTALQTFLQNDLGRAQATSFIKVTLPYSGVGSGQGQMDFLSNAVAYGVSDIPLSTAQYNALGNRRVIQIPAVLNAVGLFVNITGRSTLNLDPDTISRIFQGQITSFNDPAIKAQNPGLQAITGNNISVVTRGDASGTTALFTSYLSKAAPTTWKLGNGLTVNFPSTVRSVTGTNSVVAALQALGNSIGYTTAGAGLAAGLTEVAVRNANGNYLTSSQGDYEDLANNLGNLPSPTGDWSNVNLTYISGPRSFPIAGFSYYLVNQALSQDTNGALLKQLMRYLQSADVQGNTVIGGLRPLPTKISRAAEASVDAINAPASPDYQLAFSKPANAPIVTG